MHSSVCASQAPLLLTYNSVPLMSEHHCAFCASNDSTRSAEFRFSKRQRRLSFQYGSINVNANTPRGASRCCNCPVSSCISAKVVCVKTEYATMKSNSTPKSGTSNPLTPSGLKEQL